MSPLSRTRAAVYERVTAEEAYLEQNYFEAPMNERRGEAEAGEGEGSRPAVEAQQESA